MISRILIQFSQAIDGLNEWVGRIIAWLTLLMVLVMFFIVVLRYGWSWNSIALQESVSYFHALVFMAGIAYAATHDTHVRVDIFYREMSARRKAWVDLGGTLFMLLPLCIFIFWTSIGYVVNAWARLEGSHQTGGLPLLFLFKSFIPLMSVLLGLHAIAQIIKHSFFLFSDQSASTDNTSQGDSR